MNNQTKWNKELLYSVIFFVAINAMNFSDLLSQILMSNFVFNIEWSVLKALRLTTWYPHINLYLPICFFFLLCSVYLGIKSMKKASVGEGKKILGFMPNNIPWGLAFLMVSISLLEIISILIAIFRHR